MKTLARILVAAATPEISAPFAEPLRRAGYEVEEARTGQGALERVRQNSPHLLLVAAPLPDLSAPDLCRLVKGDIRLADVFVVLVSGRPGAGTGRQERADGADDCISESASEDELLAHVATTLRLQQTTSALRDREERLRLGLATARMVSWSWDAASDRLSYSIDDSSGVPEGELIPVFATFGEMKQAIHPDDLPRVEERLRQATTEDVPYAVDFRIRLKDGKYHWIHSAGRVFRDEDRRPVRMLGISMDVTERRAVQESARQRETYFQALIENAQDLIVVIDAEGLARYASPSVQRVLGYAPEEVTGRCVLEYIHPEEAAAVGRLLVEQRTIPGVGGWTVHRLRHKNGEWRTIEFIGNNRIDDPGVQGWVINARDITERQQAQEALRQREEHFRALLENALDLVMVLDAAGQVTYAGPSVQRVLGFAPEEVIGRSCFELAHPDEVEACRRFHEEATKTPGTTPFRIHRLRHKDGSWRLIEVGGNNRLHDPSVRGIVINGRDITQRAQAQAQLRDAEAKYRFLVENIPVVTWLTDEEGRTNYISPNVIHVYGYSAEEICAAGGALWFDRIHPDDRGRVREGFASVFAGGSFDAEYRIRAKDGRWIWLHDRGMSVVEQEGVRYAFGVFSDITARKQAEERLAETLELNHTMVAASPVGITTYRASGPCVFANEAMASILNGSTEQVLAQDFRQIRSWQESGLLQLAEEVIETGEGRSGEIHAVTSFGKEVWLDCHLARFTSGDEFHLLLMAHDISERKIAERSLRAQRDLGTSLGQTGNLGTALERLLEAAMQIEAIDCGGIYLVDDETGDVQLMAHRGLSPEFVQAASRYASETEQARLVKAGQPHYAYHRENPAWAQDLQQMENLQALAVIPLCHEGIVLGALNLASHTCADIPARMLVAIEALAAQAGGAIARIKAEQARRETESLLRAFFDSPGASRGIVELVDNDMLVVSSNAALAARYGRTSETIRGARASELGVDRAVIDMWIAGLRQSQQKGESVTFEYSSHFRTPNTWGLSTVSHLGTSRHGRPQFAFVAIDITERKKAEMALRELPTRIFEAQENERQRVARDLHDGVNQLISSTKFRLHMVEESGSTFTPEARQTLVRCEELLAQALDESRRIARNLRPRDLDDLGLTAACRNLCSDFHARTGMVVQYDASTVTKRLPAMTELHLFRIVQEALNNVEKYSGATRVRVCLVPRGRAFELKIEDNGRGFDPEAVGAARKTGSGFGLTNIRERAGALGGTCDIKSAPGEGTMVRVRVPMETGR